MLNTLFEMLSTVTGPKDARRPAQAKRFLSRMNRISKSKGTCVFTWHDGRSRYDEVAWIPEIISRDLAGNMALEILKRDPRATVVHVESGDRVFFEATRRPLAG